MSIDSGAVARCRTCTQQALIRGTDAVFHRRKDCACPLFWLSDFGARGRRPSLHLSIELRPMRSSVIRSHLPLSCVLFGALVLSACAQQEQPAPPAPQVVVDTVQRRDLPLKLKYPARVSGSRVVEVRARVSGVIVERAYREGQRVKAGDLLFRIEPDVYRATHEQ